MKKLITLSAFLFPFLVFAQNKTCTNGTLSIDLRTPASVDHKVNTAYAPVMPVASSTVYSSNFISLVKTSSDVDPNFTGIYTECFEATDKDGLKVECCRNVIVKKDMPGSGSVANVQPFQILIFPNPAIDKQFTVQLSNSVSSDNIELTLCDMLGRQVLNISQPFQSEITVSTVDYFLNSGLYTLTIKQGNTTVNKVIALH